MAKFKRFDPRNKKQNKHKHDSKYAFIERKLNGTKTVEKYKLGTKDVYTQTDRLGLQGFDSGDDE